MYNFLMFFFVIRKKIIQIWAFFCQKLPFLPQNAWFFFLKSKNGVLEIFLKSNILCTKILGTVKFFLKSKNFLKSNVLKSKIHCTTFTPPDFEALSKYYWHSWILRLRALFSQWYKSLLGWVHWVMTWCQAYVIHVKRLLRVHT